MSTGVRRRSGSWGCGECSLGRASCAWAKRAWSRYRCSDITCIAYLLHLPTCHRWRSSHHRSPWGFLPLPTLPGEPAQKMKSFT
jgi:hypothetical protein